MSRRKDDTPPEGPMAKRASLVDLIHDTPPRPMTALDTRLMRFNADLDSIPPPALSDDFVRSRIRQAHQSGSWELEAILAEQANAIKRIAASEMARELDERMRAESELLSIKTSARKWLFTVTAGLAVGVGLGIIGFVAQVLWTVSHQSPQFH